jgi:predicted PolB exonuclease-like 3'-5' exonuclease
LNLPDEKDQKFNNFEKKFISTYEAFMHVTKFNYSQPFITPISISRNINIDYHHWYTVKKMDDEEIDISAFLQNLTQHTTVQSLSKVLQFMKPSNSLSLVKLKMMSLYLTHSKPSSLSIFLIHLI